MPTQDAIIGIFQDTGRGDDLVQLKNSGGSVIFNVDKQGTINSSSINVSGTSSTFSSGNNDLSVILNCGVSGTPHTGAIYFQDNGNYIWGVRKLISNYFAITDQQNGAMNRFLMVPGDQTIIESVGTAAVKFNVDNNSGTGGVQFYSGGATSSLVGLINNAGMTKMQRYSTSFGGALTAANFALSAGFGSTASIGSITGTDQAFQATITVAGTGQAANPTVTLTFHDGAWAAAPIYVVSRGGGSQPTVQFSVTSVTATALTLTFNGTPVAADTYTFSCIGMGIS
jgi:hypothetical protein